MSRKRDVTEIGTFIILPIITQKLVIKDEVCFSLAQKCNKIVKQIFISAYDIFNRFDKGMSQNRDVTERKYASSSMLILKHNVV